MSSILDALRKVEAEKSKKKLDLHEIEDVLVEKDLLEPEEGEPLTQAGRPKRAVMILALVAVTVVFGVATFYSLFSMKPKGRNAIKVCKGTACYVRGIKEVIARIGEVYKLKEDDTTEDRRFSLESVRCLGACGLAPAMVVGADTHGGLTANKVVDILEKYE